MSPLADDMGIEDGIMPPGHLVVPRMLASGNEVVSLHAAKESRQSPKSGRNGKQEMGQVTPEHVQGILINPFYAIQVAPELVETHEPSMQDEEWITGNSSLIEKIGVEQWLALLLDVL